MIEVLQSNKAIRTLLQQSPESATPEVRRTLWVAEIRISEGCNYVVKVVVLQELSYSLIPTAPHSVV